MLNEAADRKGVLQLCSHGAGHVRLTHLDLHGEEIGRPHDVECCYEGGIEEVRFKALSTYRNLSLSGSCSSKPGTPFRINIVYDLSCWLGRPLSTLTNFDLMHDLLGDLAEGHRMNIEFFADAGLLFSGFNVWSRVEMDSIRRLLGVVELAGKARWIAQTFGVEAALPRLINGEHLREVTRLYRLARGDEIRMKDAVATDPILRTAPALPRSRRAHRSG
jgi:hypothetical protein